MKKGFITLGVILVSAVVLYGCGSNKKEDKAVKSETPSVVSINTPTPQNNNLVLGIKTPSAIKLQMKNMTGKNIKFFTIKEAAEKSFSANMIPSGKIISNDQVCELYYTPHKAVSSVVLTGNVDRTGNAIKIVFEDDTTAILKKIDLSKIKDSFDLVAENGVYFVKYKDQSGAEISTKDDEIKAQNEPDDSVKSTVTPQNSYDNQDDQNSDNNSNSSEVDIPKGTEETYDTDNGNNGNNGDDNNGYIEDNGNYSDDNSDDGQ